eukprot:6174609-Pleurochrysis_carterae.AAC.1
MRLACATAIGALLAPIVQGASRKKQRARRGCRQAGGAGARMRAAQRSLQSERRSAQPVTHTTATQSTHQ